MHTFRIAQHADADHIADLHTRSWRVAYRGILSEDYLDDAIVAERLAVWRERFANPAANQRMLVAEEGGVLLGFICLFLDNDPVRGTLIDNLHVDPTLKNQGIGSGLMREAARLFIPEAASLGLYLGVYEANIPATAFYEHMGGTCIGRELHDKPGGGQALILWYGWARGIA